MDDFEVGGELLGSVHGAANRTKFFCHFTGFLEGVSASGAVEIGEITPLIAECEEFVTRINDDDAREILEDFKLQLLEYETIDMMASVRANEIDSTCEKSKLNRFLGFCRGIVCDGMILLKEAQTVVGYLEASPELLSVIGVRQIYVSCLDAIEDGYISAQENDDICDAIGAIVGDCYVDTGLSHTFGVANFPEYRIQDFEIEIEGANICFTGTFQTSPRRLLEERVSEFGAVVKASVSKQTDFVIVGGEASRDWIEMNRGTKIRKAQQLRNTQTSPEFVSEIQLLRHIGS